MIALAGVAIHSKIYESSASLVYRGIREVDNRALVVKLLKPDYSSPQELTRYREEYEITVVAYYSGNAEKAEKAVAEIESKGGSAITLQADVSNVADVERLFQETLNRFGTINVVVYCAGFMSLKPIVELDIEIFDKIIATNLRGTFLMLQQAAKHLPSGGPGS